MNYASDFYCALYRYILCIILLYQEENLVVNMVASKPYPFDILTFADWLSDWLIAPFIWSLDSLLSLFIPTTKELKSPLKLIPKYFILSAFYFPICLTTFPITLWGFAIRLVISWFRSYYICSYNENSVVSEAKRTKARLDNQEKFEALGKEIEHIFGIGTINNCLGSEVFCRISNLDNPKARAQSIGEKIVIDQFFYNERLFQNHRTFETSNQYENKAKNNEDVKEALVCHFSHLDLICFQEMFSKKASEILMRELHKVYPYIVHDAGQRGMTSNWFLWNSGLMIASRYPVLEVDFKAYSAKSGFLKFVSSGLLMVKVSISPSLNGRQLVGYIYNTHLQAYEGNECIVPKQLDNIIEWTTAFRKKTSVGGDHVLFDVVCGDFNCDNTSPGDLSSWSHRLFDVYTDVCRVRPGMDKNWTVGTEHRSIPFWDEDIATPEGLREALLNPYKRQYYMVDGDLKEITMKNICSKMPEFDQHGNLVLTPGGGKRRIDYVLFRQDEKSQIEIKNYNFVTRLAQLTDHLAVTMTIQCKTDTSKKY